MGWLEKNDTVKLRVCTRNEFVSQELFWLSRYRQLNIVFDREPDLFVAHI
jgi:hypothetical protein